MCLFCNDLHSPLFFFQVFFSIAVLCVQASYFKLKEKIIHKISSSSPKFWGLFLFQITEKGGRIENLIFEVNWKSFFKIEKAIIGLQTATA